MADPRQAGRGDEPIVPDTPGVDDAEVDAGPRLPPAVRDPATEQKRLAEIDVWMPHSRHTSFPVQRPTIPDELPTYRHPPLVRPLGWLAAWTAAGVLTVVWALTIAVLAVEARSDALAGEPGDDALRVMGAVGLALGVVNAAAAAGWSDARTRNIHALDGKYPSRSRAIRVWAYPVVWVLLMSITLVPLDPHPDLDVRPAIIVVGFALTAWRPFSLLRRLFTSLIRVRPDALVSAIGVVATVAYGLMWWRLTVWPRVLSTADVGDTEALIGTGFASALAFSVVTVLVVFLDRAATRAEQHRIRALQTREEHRFVRSLGLNPYEAEVYRALVAVKMARERRRLEAEREEQLLGSDQTATVVVPGAAEPIAVARVEAADSGALTDGPDVSAVVEDDRAQDALPASAARSREDGEPTGREAEAREATTPSDVMSEVAMIQSAIDDRFRPARLFALEATRYLVLLLGLSTVVGFGWIALGAIDLAEPVSGGAMSALDADRIEEARSVTVTVLSLWLPAISLWAYVVSLWARRAGAPVTRERSCLAVFGLSAALIVTARVVDPTSITTASYAVTCVVAGLAAASLYLVQPVSGWSGRGMTTAQIWGTGLLFLVLITGIAGAHQPVGVLGSIEELAFFGVVQGLLAAVLTVLAAVMMVDIENDLRGSARLAEFTSRRTS